MTMMEQMHRQNGVVALLTAALLVGLSQAFVIPLGTSNQGTTTFLSGGGVRLQRQQLPTLAQPWTTILYMAEKGDETTDEGTGDATAAAVEEEEEVVDLGAEPENEEEPKEDPEMVALKAEIAKLEADVKVARRKAADTSDRAEGYTKTGYARKVAEMENMRRARSMLQSSNKFSATAGVLTEFLPVMDTLITLREKYGDDEFGKQYNALPNAMKNAFSVLGVTDFTITTGDVVDKSRMVVIDSEYSADFPKDTVIRPVAMGMELQGNVIRMAECVASLGSEPPAAVEAESAELEDAASADASAEDSESGDNSSKE